MSTSAVVPDPYAAYGGQVASGGGADPYAAYGGKVGSPAPPTDDRNSIQKSFDANTKTSPNEPLLETGLKSVVGAIGAPFVHPVDTLNSLGNLINPDVDKNPILNAVHSVGNDYKAGGAAYAATKLAGNTVGGVALGGAGGAAADALPAVGNVVRNAVAATGQAAEDSGIGLMNKTVGTLKSDFKRGANPARGYFATDNGPALSMQSIADKASDALDATGTALGTAYKTATAKGVLIPVDTVAQELAKPIQKAIDLESGPGGTGNLDPIQSYVKQFAPAFDKAAAQGGFTPSDLFDIKRSIAQNTNWSDPAQFSLKAVRQQQAGALSGILSDAVPETSQLNQNYQDLTKLADRATERAATGSRPLTAHIYKAGMAGAGALAGALDGHALAGVAAGAVADSVPFKTTLATGLVRGGRALQSLATPSDGAAMEGITSEDLGANSANGKDGNPQSAPLQLTNGSTTGPERWANDGAARVAQHIASDPSSGLTKADIADAASTPYGKRLLINASDLTPGSPAMRNLVQQIKMTLGATK